MDGDSRSVDRTAGANAGTTAVPARRVLVAAVRRVLWGFLRLHAGERSLRGMLRERLRSFLARASHPRLLRLLREATLAGAVATALLCAPASTVAQTVELANVALGQGGVAVRGERKLASGIGSSIANAGDVNGDGIPDAIVGGIYCAYLCHPVPAYVVFGKAEGSPVDIDDVEMGTGGFVIRVEGTGTGQIVSGTGDVNGDGLADLLLGAPGSRVAGDGNAGASYVVFGKPTTEAVELDDIAEGRGGFVIRGERDHDESGRSVSGAGDVNGDGLADLLICAPYNDSSYVVFGKPTTEAVELSDVADGRGGFVIRGPSRGGSENVAGAGDVNGDGLADVLIGVPRENNYEGGVSFVVFGKQTTEAVEHSAVAEGRGGFVIRGNDGWTGWDVAGAGDVNGDGLADLLVGAPYASPGGISLAGETYVVFGKRDGAAVELLEVQAGRGGFAIRGAAKHHQSGKIVAGAGDVNGDGHADLLIGSGDGDYVVFGKPSTGTVELSRVATGLGGFVMLGSNAVFGTRLDGGGEINGDGLADLLIGVPPPHSNGEPDGGASYVVFGKVTTAPVQLAEVASTQGGYVIRGFAGRDYSELVVFGAGDVNGDGLADMIVGAPRRPYFRGPGESYVVFGRREAEAFRFVEVAAGNGGFAIRGEAGGDLSGWSVSGAGDVNGDGLDDLTVGAPKANPHGRLLYGAAYVVFGKATTDAVELSTVAAGQGGFVIRGETDTPYGRVGYSVAEAGDIDGDGLSDLLIGAAGSLFLPGPGASY